MRSILRWTSPLLAACLLAAAAGSGRAENPAPSDKDKAVDALVYTTLREVINKGADLYNPPSSDYSGCWRLYEGALITVKPFLSHRPALQENITKGLTAAYNESSIGARAFVLRKVIDDIRTTVNPRGGLAAAPGGAAPPPAGERPAPADTAKTLWDKLGGEANVKRVVDDFVAAAAPDPKVNFLRNDKYKLDAAGAALLKRRLVEFVSAATGGPLKYEGKDMKTAHLGMGITNAEFNALAGHLKTALEKNGAKPDDVNSVLLAVGGTRKDIVEAKEEPKPAEPAKPSGTQTLWDKLGGEKNVAKVVDDLFASAGADPKVNFFRDKDFRPTAEEVATLKKKVIEFFSAATGGPLKYNGKDMKSAHKNMRITDAEFDAFAGHLKKALEKNGATAEDVKTVMDAVGGTRKDIVEKPAEK
jgi:hemoglobin